MALISKMNRCAFCGSSEVVYSEATGLYHCPGNPRTNISA